MNKYCLGCGIKLQTRKEDELGYTKNMEMSYCMRCYRITNYHDLKVSNAIIDEDKIIEKINQQSGFVFFLIDFINIHTNSLRTFLNIKLPKQLVISKLDSIPKSVKLESIRRWFEKNYGINDVIFIRKNSLKSKNKIIDRIKNVDERNIYFMGVTNAGKSTFLNDLFDYKNITISEMPNTTLDILKVGVIFEKNIYDTPGVCNTKILMDISCLKRRNIKSEIKPKIYPLKKGVSLIIDDLFRVSLKDDGVLTWFASENVKILKVYENNQRLKMGNRKEINVSDQENVSLKGIGFFYFKKKNTLIIESMEEVEIIKTKSFLGGGNYE